MATRRLEVQLIGDSRSLDRAFRGASASSGRLQSTFHRLAGAAKVAGAALTAGAVLAGKKAVSAASDLEEAVNKANETFDASAPMIQRWSRGTADAFGISRAGALDAAASVGAMLKPMGFATSRAAEMSRKMVELAGDMGSFNNQDPAEMLERIRSGLAGESEPLRRFGVDLRVAAVEAFGLKEGLIEQGEEIDNQAFTMLAYRKILADTADQQGDFGRTSDSVANQQRILAARAEDLAAKLGKALLPAATSVLGVLVDLTRQAPRIKAALTAAFEVVRNVVRSVIEALRDFWRESAIVRGAVDFLGDTVKRVWPAIKAAFEGGVKIIRGAVKVISGILTLNFGRAWDGVKDIFRGALKVIGAIIRGATAPFREAAARIGEGMRKAFAGAWDKITGVFRAGKDAAIDFINLIIKAINLLPFIPDIGLIGGGKGSSYVGLPKTSGGRGRHAALQERARGGVITAPMAIVGEEAPRHKEFVIPENPAYRGRALALWGMAGRALGVPGFQEGGLLQGIRPTNVAGALAQNAGSIIDRLPSLGDLPGWLRPMGSGLVKRAAEFIREKFQGLLSGGGSEIPGALKGALGRLGSTLSIAGVIARMFGLTITSGYRSPAHNAAVGGVPGSLHTHGTPSNPGAVDLVGSAGAMARAMAWARSHLKLRELLVHDVGSGLHLHLGFFRRGGIIQSLWNRPTLGPDGMATIFDYLGLSPAMAELLAAIGMAESHGRLSAVGDSGQSHGPFQIHHPSWPQFDPDRLKRSWLYSARAAMHVLRTQGLGAWTTYRTGAYRPHMGGRSLLGSGARGQTDRRTRDRRRQMHRRLVERFREAIQPIVEEGPGGFGVKRAREGLRVAEDFGERGVDTRRYVSLFEALLASSREMRAEVRSLRGDIARSEAISRSQLRGALTSLILDDTGAAVQGTLRTAGHGSSRRY